MISYKVLIALTVTNIIICCSFDGVEGMTLYGCTRELEAVRFMFKSGLLNYSFVKQFLLNAKNENTQLNDKSIAEAALNKFKEHVKVEYGIKEPHTLLTEYFMYNATITEDNKLKTPTEFCTALRNEEPELLRLIQLNDEPEFFDFLLSFLPSFIPRFIPSFFSSSEIPEKLIEVSDCVGEILKKQDDEILKTQDGKNNITEIEKAVPDEILKTQDGKNNITEIEKGKILRIDSGNAKIEYGADKFKNLIITNILRVTFKEIRNKIKENWSDCKLKYFKYHISVFYEARKNDDVYQDETKWCEKTKGYKIPPETNYDV